MSIAAGFSHRVSGAVNRCLPLKQGLVLNPDGPVRRRDSKRRHKQVEAERAQRAAVAVASDRLNVATRPKSSRGPRDRSGRRRIATAAKVVLLQLKGDVPHGEEGTLVVSVTVHDPDTYVSMRFTSRFYGHFSVIGLR